MTTATSIDRHRPTPRRSAGAVLAGLVLLLGLVTATAVPAQASTASGTLRVQAATALPDPGAAEAEFIARINQLRSSRGLAPLSVDPELTAQARQWAATMSSQGRIFHSGDLSAGISANWQKLGENVGVGPQVGSLFDAFVASPTHYANLVDPIYTRVGVGVVNAGDRLYTAHRFMGLAPAPPPPPPPPSVPPTVPPTTAAPVTAPPTTAPPTAPPPTTTTAPPEHHSKLGPIERIAELIAAEPDDQR